MMCVAMMRGSGGSRSISAGVQPMTPWTQPQKSASNITSVTAPSCHQKLAIGNKSKKLKLLGTSRRPGRGGDKGQQHDAYPAAPG